MRARVPLVRAFVLSILLSETARAESIRVDTDPGSGILIQVQRSFLAVSGAQPLLIDIQNESRRDRSWVFDFLSYGSSGSTRSTSASFAVSSGESRRFELVVPFAGESAETGSLQMSVLGYGVVNPSFQHPLSAYGQTPEGETFLAFSRELHASVQRGIAFEPDLLPSDWRGLLSLRAVVLREEEWQKAGPGARAGLTDWAARGGRLVRLGDLGEKSFELEKIGLGAMVRAPSPSSNEEWATALELPSLRQSIPYRRWAEQHFPPIETRSGPLLFFLVGYTLLVGPVNLFVFCSNGRRARLFWTMPTIALSAAALLGMTIVFQDGLGGEGFRVSFVRLVPELPREVVVQEQVSRTGALLKTGFDLRETAAVFHPGLGFSPYQESLASAGSSFRGGWFRSRSIQSQRLETVRAGRARIEWVSEAAGRFVSSLEDPLEEIHYRDEEGRCWKALDIHPGGETALAPEAEAEYERFWKELSRLSGPSVRGLLDDAYWERGAFLARARSSRASIETLSGIDWDDTVIYSGRILEARGGP